MTAKTVVSMFLTAMPDLDFAESDMNKLENILRESWIRPKVQKLREGLSERTKENRKETKRRNSIKKEGRRSVDF